MSPGEPLHSYEMHWYVTFYDEHGQQLDRRQIGQEKTAIPLDAMYMTFDAELKLVAGAGFEPAACGL